jgi:Winged helix-turn helix
MPPPPLRVTLDPVAQAELEHRYHRPHPGQPPHYRPGWEKQLVWVADLDPHQVAVDSALWTCRLLADYLAEQRGHRAGVETVRVVLHRAGFVLQAAPLGAQGPCRAGRTVYD